jgi:hypothetical protein
MGEEQAKLITMQEEAIIMDLVIFCWLRTLIIFILLVNISQTIKPVISLHKATDKDYSSGQSMYNPFLISSIMNLIKEKLISLHKNILGPYQNNKSNLHAWSRLN